MKNKQIFNQIGRFLHDHWIALCLIGMTVLSISLRLYKLDEIPSTLNRDEAAIAYNAYLLKETGMDEWGRKWPLALESFGDYKLPGYPLLVIPLYQIFGLDDWVVRLPAAIVGGLVVLVAFFFAQALEQNNKRSLMFAFLVGTTPVLFFFSHMAFEAMVALVLFWGGITLLLSSQRLTLSLFGLLMILFAVFTYNTPLLLLPFALLFIVIWKHLHKQPWLPIALGMMVIGIVAGWQLLTLASQKSGVTIFQDESIWLESIRWHQQFAGLWQTLLGNRYVFYIREILIRYWRSVQPSFLIFGEGGHPWHSVPETGHLLVVTSIFGVIGFGKEVISVGADILKKQFSTSTIKTVAMIGLLVTSLLPAVVTVDAPHATRSLLFFVLISWYALIGMITSYHLIKKVFDSAVIGKVIVAAVVIVIGIEFITYFYTYMTTYPEDRSKFQPHFEETISQVETNYPTSPIAVVDPEGYQYILLAWYLKIPPQQFFSSVVRQLPDKIGFRYGQQVTHYHFIVQESDRDPSEELLIIWENDQWVIRK